MKCFMLFITGVIMSFQIYSQEDAKNCCKNEIDQNGQKQGEWKEVWDDFSVYYVKQSGCLIGTYTNNKKEGIWISYYTNGQIKSKDLYKSNFLWQQLAAKDSLGKDLGIGSLNEGKGIYRYYYGNGILMYEQEYYEGKIKGEGYYYDKTGKLEVISCSNISQADEYSKSTIQNGKIKEISHINSQGLAWNKTFNSNGTLIFEQYYNSTDKLFYFKEYDKKGRIKIRGQTYLGSATGKWEYFDSKGKLVKTINNPIVNLNSDMPIDR